VRILVTNDDGIDSTGLHVLARSLLDLGDVVVAAPDREYSGCGAGVGTFHLAHPEVHEVTVDGIEEAWSVTGAPALCVMFAGLGVFGDDPFDLVVAGINPGANVGRSIYHSGTVGACLTARNGGVSGVAVSQAVDNWGIEGQASDDMLDGQLWDTAGTIAAGVVGGFIADLPTEPEVLNINVPNAPLADLRGWRRTEVGRPPARSMGSVRREPKEGHEGAYKIKMTWGEPAVLPEHVDGGAVMHGWVSISCLGRIESVDSHSPAVKRAEAALDDLLG
jgi:5'/3'-nucleotidase